jgi:hypothetical protein
MLVDVPTLGPPTIGLESVDEDEVVVRIRAVPVQADDGWRLADQVLAAIDRVVTEDMTLEDVIGERAAPADRLRPVAEPTEGDPVDGGAG